MAEISKEDFLACVEASGIVDNEYLDANKIKFAGLSTTAIAKDFIRDEILTPWQAKYLLSGRSRLHIGNYRLLERIRRDEFGDRFFAIHEQLDRMVEISSAVNGLSVMVVVGPDRFTRVVSENSIRDRSWAT